MLKKILNKLAFFSIFFVGFYIGIGGMGVVDYDKKLTTLSTLKPEINDTIAMKSGGITYNNKLEMQRAEVVIQKEKFLKWYPWIEGLPDLIILLFTCCAFSLLGTYIWIVRDLTTKKRKISGEYHTISIISGSLTGLIILGLSFLLPVILVNEGGQIRPITLMFLSLFGGMYSNKLYEKLSNYVDQMFKAS